MTRPRMPFSTWTRAQIILVLGPAVLAVALVALYLGGGLPISLTGLVVLVMLVNLGGDLLYAWRNERSTARDRLRNDVVGQHAVADNEFRGECRPYRGAVTLGAERWYASSRRRIGAGDRVEVVGRRGLILDVVPDRRDSVYVPVTHHH